MNNVHIKDYLNYFVKTEYVKYAVLLKGSWGAGKTFFVKKMIEEWSIEKEQKGDSITFTPLYISLNGLGSKKEIIEKIKEKIKNKPFFIF